MPTASLPRTRAVLLGPVALVVDGVEVPLRSARSRALLVTLALARGRTVPVRTLVEDLWPDEPPHDPRASLHTVVSRLRSRAPGVVVSDGAGYRLGCPSDVDHVEALCAQARTALSTGDLDLALAIVADGRDEGSRADDTDEDLPEDVAVELARLRVTWREAFDRLALDVDAAAGRWAQALPVAEDLCQRHPTDEAIHLLLMQAYAGLGRVNDALRVFARVHERVADELGTSPGASLVELNTRLLAAEATAVAIPAAAASGAARPGTGTLVPGGTPSETQPAPAPRSVGVRLSPTPLLGREDEVAGLLGALGSSRLVSVLGPGGLGKTRIAQEVARRTVETGTRVVVVELASIRTDEDVVLAVASTLGVRDEVASRRIGDRVVRTDTLPRVLDRLDEVPTLLVLDNCEHVVAGAAAWTLEVLAATRARVLTTSRSPLLVPGEHLVPLTALAASTPDGSGPATELFRARAQAVRPDVVLPPDVVDRLVRRLDGLPLAIELAAARVRTLSVVEIEERLSARFELLTAGDRAAPARHRTLQAVIEWSWNLLSPHEQAVLRRVALFPAGFGALGAHVVGTFDIENGRYVTQASVAVLDALDGLVQQSLLSVVQEPTTGAVRFRMLETVREFGELELARSGETARARDALSAWAVGHSTREWPHLMGRTQVATMRDAALEQENLLHVLRGGIADHRGDVVAPTAAYLGLFWSLRGAHADVSALAPDVVAALRGWEVTEDDAGSAGIVFMLMLATTFMSGPTVGRSALGRLRRLLRRPEQLPPLVRGLATIVVEARDEQHASTALADARGTATGFVALGVHLMSAQVAENAGDLAGAVAFARVAHRLATEQGDVWGAATSAMLLGQLANELGRPAESERWVGLAREGLTALEAEADLNELRWIEASSAAALGRYDEAEATFDTILAEAPDSHARGPAGSGLDEMRPLALAGRADVAYLRGDLPGALALYAEAEAAFAHGPLRSSPWFTMLVGGQLAVAVQLEDPSSARLARVLRARILATHRVLPTFPDRPVMGASVVGLGAYLTQEPELGRVGDGLELLALADALGARQDTRAMRVTTHLDAARRRYGDTPVDTAQAAVAALAEDEVVARTVAILRRGPWQT